MGDPYLTDPPAGRPVYLFNGRRPIRSNDKGTIPYTTMEDTLGLVVARLTNRGDSVLVTGMPFYVAQRAMRWEGLQPMPSSGLTPIHAWAVTQGCLVKRCDHEDYVVNHYGVCGRVFGRAERQGFIGRRAGAAPVPGWEGWHPADQAPREPLGTDPVRSRGRKPDSESKKEAKRRAVREKAERLKEWRMKNLTKRQTVGSMTPKKRTKPDDPVDPNEKNFFTGVPHGEWAKGARPETPMNTEPQGDAQ